MYYGCIKRSGDKHWCVVKDETAEKGFRRVNCSDSCPKNTVLSEVKLSPKEIAKQLKTNPKLSSKIERGGNCTDYMASYNITQVDQKIL